MRPAIFYSNFFRPAIFYSNFLAAILKMAYLTVIGLHFSLETVIFAFYGKFPIRMRMSPYSTNDVRMDFFLGFVSEMESRLNHDNVRAHTDKLLWHTDQKYLYRHCNIQTTIGYILYMIKPSSCDHDLRRSNTLRTER